jgi:hypothetical protein
MDKKETAEKQKGEGKGPDVKHSLKLLAFVSIFWVHVLKYLISFIALFAQLAEIYICTDAVSEHTDKYCFRAVS